MFYVYIDYYIGQKSNFLVTIYQKIIIKKSLQNKETRLC